MSAITIGGDLVHYEKLGRGRPVILIHGWVGAWRYWIPLMQHLHLKYSVYTLDLPGFGDSAKNPQKYSVPKLVEMLVLFMEQMAIPKAAMIGHGLGGMVLAEFALLHPDKVARMLLTSMPLYSPEDLSERIPVGTRVALTSNTSSHAAPTVPNATAASTGTPLTSNTGAPSTNNTTTSGDSHEATMMSRASTPSVTPVPLAHDAPTLARVDSGVIDRQKLLERAREVQAKASLGNPLMDAFTGKTPAALLDKTYKKTDPVYEKLKIDVDKTDFRVLETTAASYEPGRMLDNLRRIASPVCIVHGMSDPILTPPSDEVWNYLQQDKDDTFLPIPLENVRHFPMLEHEPFPRLATDFLEAVDLTKLEIRERWKRRSR